MNDTSRINQVVPSIKGQDIFDVLERDFFLFHETKQVIYVLPPVTYAFHSELDAIKREMLGVSFPSTSIWKRISMFVDKWNVPESSFATTS